jgi:flagellar basal body-associated protein FliL
MTDIKEPNFEGEVMHMPEAFEAAPTAPAKKIMSLPIIILLVTILVLLLAGLGYWYYQVMSLEVTPAIDSPRPTANENNEPESTTAEARAQATNVVSTSDEIDAIKADIESTPVTDLLTEMPAIETELDAALAQ